MKKKLLTVISLILCIIINAQEVSLFKQFGGHIDFALIGNTLNTEENGTNSTCIINTGSSATLSLDTNDQIIAAYLYWAGSGTGDFNVVLNEKNIIAERRFSNNLEIVELPFFSAFKDISQQVKDTGIGNYMLSELDLNDIIIDFCPNGTNFAGWAIVIIYENSNFPLNQINIYDGLQHVPNELNIELTNLDVIDTIDSKIGFIAWEGDAFLSVNESLFINNNLIGNPPLNPPNNAFNGTNSSTNSNQLFNMDIDIYSIENNISVGDDSLNIRLTSGQDFVMINTIITKLNSQLPDASVQINDFEITSCNDFESTLSFTVYNDNATKELPVNTSINIYAKDDLLATIFTTSDIQINGSESFKILLTIPQSLLQNFTLRTVVNEINPVLEIRTNNNDDSIEINYPLPPTITQPSNIKSCNIGNEIGIFNFNEIQDELLEAADDNIALTFYPNETNYLNDTASINPVFDYQNSTNPQTIYIKATSELTGCYTFTTFDISVYNCPPFIPEAFSPNGDGINDEFYILNLYNIFTDFKLEIYNRWGSLVFESNQNSLPWNGRLFNNKKLVPTGVYFYILNLNDPNYKPIQGVIYTNR
jgi:gliding motility-associated-like protein